MCVGRGRRGDLSLSGETDRGIAGRFAAMHERNLSLLTQFVAPRYCDEPFPAYRFIPGCNPHPTADPRGHSYAAPGAQGPSVVWVAPQDWAKSTDYRYGCDLYNHAYWWEAHEAWEGLWQLTEKEGMQGRFLKGLIQMSACHLKRFVGHSGLLMMLDISRITISRNPRDGYFYYTRASVVDSYEVLRQFIDSIDRLQGCLILVSPDVDFLSEETLERGFGAYEALKFRIVDEVRDRQLVNPMSSLIRLRGDAQGGVA